MLIEEQPQSNYENARRLHHEYYAPAVVHSWWLRLFAAGVTLSLILLAAGELRTAKQLRKEKILLVAVAQDGSLDRLVYVNMADYKPTDKVLQHFAVVWATKYYSRLHATIARDYPDSFEFFDAPLVKTLRNRAEQTQWVQEFEQSADADVRITVKKVRVDPETLTIDFEKHFWLSGREAPEQREDWTAQVQYTVTPVEQVTNSMVPANPIGLKITALPIETKGF